MPNLDLRAGQEATAEVGDDCVLLVAAEVDEAARLLDQLTSSTHDRFRVEWVADLSSGVKRLRHGGIAAVVLDLALHDDRGLETFGTLFRAAPRVPILILSAVETEETAKKAVQRGAQDYLLRDQADGDRLRRT